MASSAPTRQATTTEPSLSARSARARVFAAVAEPGRRRRSGRPDAAGADRKLSSVAVPITIATDTAMAPTER